MRCVKGRKSGIHVAWIPAFAGMTAVGVLRVVGSFTGGDAPPMLCPTPIGHPVSMIPYLCDALRVGKAAFMLPGSSPAQG